MYPSHLWSVQADLVLARYTCVALQRLNGSAKKVKGSLLDKSVRIDMDSPVFRKLQEAIEHPCRSREWFALAEQAINTVYALGDQPEVLSNTIIKNLTCRAFRRREKSTSYVPEDQVSSAPNPDAMDEDPPQSTQALISTMPGSTQGPSAGNPAKKSDDTGDAFELSQLLFMVGHVAIKHIVYLELVEREWKRQKQEKELGERVVLLSQMSPLGHENVCSVLQPRSLQGVLGTMLGTRMVKNLTRLLETRRTRSATA
jgi:condensin complex subunit 1